MQFYSRSDKKKEKKENAFVWGLLFQWYCGQRRISQVFLDISHCHRAHSSLSALLFRQKKSRYDLSSWRYPQGGPVLKLCMYAPHWGNSSTLIYYDPQLFLAYSLFSADAFTWEVIHWFAAGRCAPGWPTKSPRPLMTSLLAATQRRKEWLHHLGFATLISVVIESKKSNLCTPCIWNNFSNRSTAFDEVKFIGLTELEMFGLVERKVLIELPFSCQWWKWTKRVRNISRTLIEWQTHNISMK